MHVAAAMFTPASEIAAATAASAPGVLSTSMTRSTAMPHPTPSRTVARVVADAPKSPLPSGRERKRPAAALAKERRTTDSRVAMPTDELTRVLVVVDWTVEATDVVAE